MSKIVSMKREREKLAFADRLAAIERVLKREGGIDPTTLAAKLLTAEQVAELLGLKLGTIRNMTSRRELRAFTWARARFAIGISTFSLSSRRVRSPCSPETCALLDAAP